MGVLGSYFGDFRTNHGSAVALVGVSGVVVVVLFLSDNEVCRLFERGDDGVVVDIAHVGDHGLRRSPLFLRKRHNARAVLRSDVVALSIELRGVVHSEEDFEEGFKRDNGRVKQNFNHFSMAGRTGAHGFVGGVDHVATGVGWKGGLDTVNLFVGAFNAPEASSANDHPFHGLWCWFAHIKV